MLDLEPVPQRHAGAMKEVEAPLYPQDEASLVVDPAQLDAGASGTRCSLKLFHEVVSKLDDRKPELVQRIGFGGLLYFPSISQINRKFAVYLMSHVEESSRYLVIPDICRIKIHKEDVVRVFGILSGWKKVIETHTAARLCKEKVLNDFLGVQFKESRSIKLLQELILSPSGNGDDAFCAAFVVFVVSILLSPSSKYDYACVDYWNAIEDASAISTFDWAEFAVVRLLDAVSKVKQDISRGSESPNVTGCSLFLQILYLDNIDTGDLVMKHDSFPRIRHFTNDRIRMMIRASFPSNCPTNGCGRGLKLRSASSSCYYWASTRNCRVIERRGAEQSSTWELAVCLSRLLNVPVEAAGPLFAALDDFWKQVDCGVCASGSHAVKYMSALGRILLSHKCGFNYMFSLSDDTAASGNHRCMSNVATSSVVSTGISILSMPDEFYDLSKYQMYRQQDKHGICMDLSNGLASAALENHGTNVCSLFDSSVQESGHVNNGISSMLAARDGNSMSAELSSNNCIDVVLSRLYLSARRMKVPACIDLNSPLVDYSATGRCNGGVISSPSAVAPPPWSIGYSWCADATGVPKLAHSLDVIRQNSRYAVIHRFPKYIEVLPDSFHEQMLGVSEFDLDMFDATIRCARQHDDCLYKHIPSVRWRHFFESDFMGCLISRCYDLSEDMLSKHVSPDVVPYDISRCSLLFFPVLLQFRWVCYAWCLVKNAIYVFDPGFSQNASEITLESHVRNGFILKLAMRKLFSRSTVSWDFDWFAADIRITPWIENSVSMFNRSGALCAMFCRCFDPERSNATPAAVEPDAVALKLFAEICMMSRNEGYTSAAKECLLHC